MIETYATVALFAAGAGLVVTGAVLGRHAAAAHADDTHHHHHIGMPADELHPDPDELPYRPLVGFSDATATNPTVGFPQAYERHPAVLGAQQLQQSCTSDLLELAATALETHPLRYTNLIAALTDRAAQFTAIGD